MHSRRPSRIGFCLILATILLMFGDSFAAGIQSYERNRDKIVFRPSGATILAERADSPDARAKGLMYRTSLAQNEGMIFRFEISDYLAFWMYNTRIPLTIIFLSETLQIVDIQDMSPCMQKNPDLCRTYTSKSVARFALELNQGFTGKHGIKVGDRVVIERGE